MASRQNQTQNDLHSSSKSPKQNHLPKDDNIPRGYREESCRKIYITATKTGKQKNLTKPLGESITKVTKCDPKIIDFSSALNTKT